MPGRRICVGALWAAWVSCAVACEHDALPWICPDLAPGALVVSELRGPQSGGDSYGQWIELYNPDTAAVTLAGLSVTVQQLDGSGERRILVRSEAIVVDGEGYVVLGRFPTGGEPEWVDYGWAADLATDLYDGGVLTVTACDVEVDSILWRDLPAVGSLGLDGAATPDADDNDDEASWCVDAEPGTDPTEVGAPGTPGARNRPCA